MKRKIAAIMLSIIFIIPRPSSADLFGGDVAMLAQILANAIQQLAQLRQVVQGGRDQLSLIRDINRGINDSLNLARTISPNLDPGLYKDWLKVSEALSKLEGIYGIVHPSLNYQVQKDTDQSVAEAISRNNNVFEYTKEIDRIGELIKSQSHNVSPGGAAKLTAQTLGVMLHVLNENLRSQAINTKLQAQSLAVQNRKDKQMTEYQIKNSKVLKSAMKSKSANFTVPRFQ